MENLFDANAWAIAYIAAHEDRALLDDTHPHHLAAYYFMEELVGPIAEECWQGILVVVKRKPSTYVVGMLAAGPVEDLITYSGLEFIDRIELEARQSPDFRRMLHGAWEIGNSEIWTRVEAARGPSESAT